MSTMWIYRTLIDSMGAVIVVFRIIPNPERFDYVKTQLEKLKPERLEVEPIAFGLKALKFTKVIPDASDVIESLENEIESIDGVNSVENIMTSRSL